MATKLIVGQFVKLGASEPNFPYKGVVVATKTRYRTPDWVSPSEGWHDTKPEYIAVDTYVVRSEDANGSALEDIYERDELTPVDQEFINPNA